MIGDTGLSDARERRNTGGRDRLLWAGLSEELAGEAHLISGGHSFEKVRFPRQRVESWFEILLSVLKSQVLEWYVWHQCPWRDRHGMKWRECMFPKKPGVEGVQKVRD
jgi:hypothetical protein